MCWKIVEKTRILSLAHQNEQNWLLKSNWQQIFRQFVRKRNKIRTLKRLLNVYVIEVKLFHFIFVVLLFFSSLLSSIWQSHSATIYSCVIVLFNITLLNLLWLCFFDDFSFFLFFEPIFSARMEIRHKQTNRRCRSECNYVLFKWFGRFECTRFEWHSRWHVSCFVWCLTK